MDEPMNHGCRRLTPGTFKASVVLCLFAATLFTFDPCHAQRTRYDPDQDYRYNLQASATTSAEVNWQDASATARRTKNAAFAWPSAAAHATVLLELRVDASSGTPAIRASAPGVATTQYFEPHASGVRYLDLTAFREVPEGTNIVLKASRLHFSPRGSTLHSFANEPVDGQRVLVVAPHPDDAEIAAFGLYSTTDADVVTVTSGDAGGFNYRSLISDPKEHYKEKGRIRVWDSVTVPFLGGVPPTRARNLGYYDATLQRLYERPNEAATTTLAELPDPGWYRQFNVDQELKGRPFEGTWKALVDDLKAEILKVKPRVIASTHPLLDGHWDHQFTTVALIEALEQLATDGTVPRNNSPKLFLYTNHPTEEEGFPFGPRDGIPSLPPWFKGDLHFEALYSVQLNEQTQDLKLLALEMMHDLRPFDLHPPVKPRTHLVRYLKALFHSSKRKDQDYRYFRRAARPAELFFVLDLEQAILLRAEFLSNLERKYDDVK